MDGITTASVLTAIATFILAGFTAWLCWETRKQANNIKKSVLIPYDLRKESINLAGGNLFAYNFTYPIVDDMGNRKRGIYHVGLKNIGDGPALNVRIKAISGSAGWGYTNEIFTVPPNGILPLVVRAVLEPDEFENAQNIIINFDDVFGKTYALQLQTHLEPNDGKSQEVVCPMVVIRSKFSDDLFAPLDQPVHRELEWRGRYELARLRQK